MIKMDAHTRNIFFSGMFVYISTVSGLIFNYSKLQENHEVRLVQLEKDSAISQSTLKAVSANISELRVGNATIAVMLRTLDKSVVQLSETTRTLSNIVVRLDERSQTKTP